MTLVGTEDLRAPWLRGRWVRRGYYICGDDICPVIGSKAEAYDPLQTAACGVRHDLIADLTSLRCGSQGLDDTAIEAFTSRWGLLGLLTHGLLERDDERKIWLTDPVPPCIPGPMHSPELWDHLREPVIQFQSAVLQFQHAVRLMQDRDRFPELQAHLNQRLHRVHPALTKNEQGDLRQSWRWPSLLAAAYLMLHRSLVGGYGYRFCANGRCGSTFSPSRSDQSFCSAECQSRNKQRRYRRNLKTK
jgi:hypothetical protein